MATTSRPHRPTAQHLTTTTPSPSTTTTTTTFLRRLHDTSPQSSYLLGFLTLVVSSGILLILTGITLTTIVLGFVFFVPIIVLSSPIWIPLVIFVFIPITIFLALCGFGVAALVALIWLYRYIRGLNPPGSDRVDYARNRIAREVKDYAREYGGYLHRKARDTAPGA